MTHRVTDRAQLKLVEEFMNYANGYLSERITWNDVMPVADFCSRQHPYVAGEFYDINWNRRILYWKVQTALSLVDIEKTWDALIDYINVYNKQK